MCVCYAGAGPGVGLLGVPSTITTITIYRCDLYGERCHHTGCAFNNHSLWATLCNAEVLTWVLWFSP